MADPASAEAAESNTPDGESSLPASTANGEAPAPVAFPTASTSASTDASTSAPSAAPTPVVTAPAPSPRKGPSPIEAAVSFTRQRTLPPKPKSEEARHLKELGTMQRAAHEAGKRREQAAQARQARRAASLARAAPVWEADIVPSWRAVLREQRLRSLWWEGSMPEMWRGRLWQAVVGNQAALSKSDYARTLKLSKREGREKQSEELYASIRQAASEVLPDLRLYQEGGPMHEELVDLSAAVCTHFEASSCPREGVINVAAMLLLHLPAPEAFLALVNLYQKSLVRSFHFDRQDEIEAYFRVFDTLLADAMPNVYANFSRQSLRPSLYLQPWINSVYTKFVNLDAATRIFDVWLLEGDTFLFRVALALLRILESRLFNPDRDELALVFAGKDKGAMAIAERETHQATVEAVYTEMGCTEEAIFETVQDMEWRDESWARLVERELPD